MNLKLELESFAMIQVMKCQSIVLGFQFQSSSNQAEYEAAIVGLKLVYHVKASSEVILSDSRLVVRQMI